MEDQYHFKALASQYLIWGVVLLILFFVVFGQGDPTLSDKSLAVGNLLHASEKRHGFGKLGTRKQADRR